MEKLMSLESVLVDANGKAIDLTKASIADVSGGNVMNPGVYNIDQVGVDEVPNRGTAVNIANDQVIMGVVVAKANEPRKTISLASGSKRFPIGGLGQHPGSTVNGKPATQTTLADVAAWNGKYLAIEDRRQDKSHPLPSLSNDKNARERFAIKYVISIHDTQAQAEAAFTAYQKNLANQA